MQGSARSCTQPQRRSVFARALLVALAATLSTACFAETLPALSDTKRPFRKSVFTNCTTSEICQAKIVTVPAERVLQLETIACFTVFDEGAITSRHFVVAIDDDFLSTKVLIPALLAETIDSSMIMEGIANGPFFFKPGEDVFVRSFGNLTCTASGYLVTIL